MESWYIPVATLLFSVLSPILAWWGSSRYFVGRYDEQQKATELWRGWMERKIESLDVMVRANTYAVLLGRVDRMEIDVGDLQSWQGSTGDGYVRAVDVLKERVDNLVKDVSDLKGRPRR